jgi:hypothetical protein
VRFITTLREVLARETGDWTWLLQVFDAVVTAESFTTAVVAGRCDHRRSDTTIRPTPSGGTGILRNEL